MDQRDAVDVTKDHHFLSFADCLVVERAGAIAAPDAIARVDNLSKVTRADGNADRAQRTGDWLVFQEGLADVQRWLEAEDREPMMAADISLIFVSSMVRITPSVKVITRAETSRAGRTERFLGL